MVTSRSLYPLFHVRGGTTSYSTVKVRGLAGSNAASRARTSDVTCIEEHSKHHALSCTPMRLCTTESMLSWRRMRATGWTGIGALVQRWMWLTLTFSLPGTTAFLSCLTVFSTAAGMAVSRISSMHVSLKLRCPPVSPIMIDNGMVSRLKPAVSTQQGDGRG